MNEQKTSSKTSTPKQKNLMLRRTHVALSATPRPMDWLLTKSAALHQIFVPLSNTKQDESFMKSVSNCYYAYPRKLYVMHEFRGSRKTTVAKRCSARSRYFIFGPLVWYYNCFDLGKD
jgi:hypothetical protein